MTRIKQAGIKNEFARLKKNRRSTGPTPAACFVTYSDFGANTRARKQAEALLSRGYTVDCLVPRTRNSAGLVLPPGLRLYFMPVYKSRSRRQVMYAIRYFLFFVTAFATLTRLYFKKRYSYIQVATLPEFLVFTALVPRFCGVKVTLDVCDLSSELYESKFNRPRNHFTSRLVRLVEKTSLKFAGSLLTVHEPYRRKLLERGIPGHKITVLLNVADEKIFQRPTVRQSSDRDRPLHLVYHGTIARRNGLDIIVLALAEVIKTAPDLKLVLNIYGDGDNYQEVVGLARRLEVTHLINFHRQFVPVNRLPALLSGADAGLVANRRDGFMEYTLPTKLMEYVALGVPGIAARTVCIETYFHSGQLAFFEPEDYQGLANRIIELAHDREAALARAERAYTFYAVHNWPNTRERYLRGVEAVAQPGASPLLVSMSKKTLKVLVNGGLLPILLIGFWFSKLKLSMTAQRQTGTFKQVPATRSSRTGEISYRLLKRLVDLGLSLLMLAVLALPMAVIAFGIKLSSPGPFLFRQTRLGKDCRPFTIYKFRTMYRQTSPELHKNYIRTLMRAEQAGGAEAVWLPLARDSRVTAFGFWLRRTGLDELPQLFNVIKGEMSLVGPRPPLEYEVELYQGWQLARMSVLPGITGLWQVSSRGKASFEEMVRLDIDYIQRQNLALDLWIILLTVPSRLLGSINHGR
jgi:lipopolysaccharide/colanic/teichoic acid biosynthesis glycosyltransferase/glycosyltransferase involved in cell wall biosynthesis